MVTDMENLSELTANQGHRSRRWNPSDLCPLLRLINPSTEFCLMIPFSQLHIGFQSMILSSLHLLWYHHSLTSVRDCPMSISGSGCACALYGVTNPNPNS